MPKKIILYFGLISFLSYGNLIAQVFHAVIFSNTNDRTIGNSATKNAENMTQLVSDIASKMEYQLDLKVFTGKNYTFETLDSVLKNFETKPGDVVFFYINSHGYRSSTSSKFPRIYILSRKDEKRYLVSTDTINAKFMKKSDKPGSVVTIIQACNRLRSSSPDLPIDINSLADNSAENYKKLFQGKVNVMVTSSQPGKTSIATPKGSHFTLSFIKAIKELTSNTNTEDISWLKVLEAARKNSLNMNRKRYPVWDIKPL